MHLPGDWVCDGAGAVSVDEEDVDWARASWGVWPKLLVESSGPRSCQLLWGSRAPKGGRWQRHAVPETPKRPWCRGRANKLTRAGMRVRTVVVGVAPATHFVCVLFSPFLTPSLVGLLRALSRPSLLSLFCGPYCSCQGSVADRTYVRTSPFEL